MCGITGKFWRTGEHAADTHAVQRMCDALRHRGPDDEGLWAEGPAAIAMRRLSVIDLAGGHQPIFNETGRIGVVMNGEIYNYQALRDRLLASGHTLRTNSDTEVLVHLYEEMGAACVEPLRGMFAFALWDADTQTMLLARDRFGIKPLYVAEHADRVAFASELKALVAAGETDRTLDPESIDLYLQLGYIPAPRTPFTDVRKVPPAHTITYRRGAEPVVSKYWELPAGTVAAPDDPITMVRDALDNSVAAHLVADVPIAAFLSGGIDSSAIVSSAAMQGYALRAFTARYQGSGAEATNEVPLAQALADKYNVPLEIVDVEPSVHTLLEAICFAVDEPLSDESVLPTWVLSEAVAASYKVVLAGTGGDELFGGYRRHRALALGDMWGRVPAVLRTTASRVANALPEPRSGSLEITRIKRFLRAGDGPAAERYAEYVSRLSEADFRQLRAHGTPDRHLGLFAEHALPGAADGALRQALRIDYGVYLPDDLLALSDRIASAHSLEVRVPFVDHQFVDQMFPLPDSLRIRGRTQKWVLREAVRERLTPAHFSAPKRGFVGPTASWLRHELRDVLIDELSPARLERLGLFDPRMVERLLQEHFDRTANHEGILWGLLVFSIWHRQMVENT